MCIIHIRMIVRFLYFGGLNQDVVKYRLADILLLRAECRVRQGKENAAEDLEYSS